ncbi:Nucleoporin Nup43 [Coemansia sp. RSA 2599]|nr:Nucleoporin Nup43 [Coemansia sp. RSA 2598]KAJ1821502.1 Nucleoporin Nup43 [Coemansia sp. RSA 2599]
MSSTLLQVQPVARKVTALCWLPPHGGTAYTDTSLHFVTGSGGKHKELVLWTTCNPDFPKPSSEPPADARTGALASVISKVAHDGDVQRVVGLSSSVLATASSYGTLSIYNVDTESGGEAGGRGILQLRESVTAHKFSNGESAVATSLAVQPTGSADAEIASSGEDGRIAYMQASRVETLQSHEVDSTVITDICWPTAAQVAVTTRGGQIKLFDRRTPNDVAAVFVDPSNTYAFECISAHPSQPYRLATGTSTGAILLWDVRNPRKPTNELFDVHGANVWQVAFDPADATRIVSCSEDATMAVTQWVPEGSAGAGAAALGVAPEKTRGVRRISSMFNALSVNCFDACPYTRTSLLIAGSDSGNLLMERGSANGDFGDF